jgi:tetratricopeptide (TPR) repeat protein
MRLGALRIDQGRHDDAIRELNLALGGRAGGHRRAAIEFYLAHALVRREEGRIRRHTARRDPVSLADAHLRRALAMRPRFPAALYLRGRILVRYLGRVEEGRTLLREAVRLQPDLAGRARRWLTQPSELAEADLLVKARRPDDALDLLRSALPRHDDPTSKAMIEYLMANILVNKVRKQRGAVTPGGADPIEEAERRLRSSLERYPAYPEAELLLGYVLLHHLDRPEEGRRRLARAARLAPWLEPHARRHLVRPEEDG